MSSFVSVISRHKVKFAIATAAIGGCVGLGVGNSGVLDKQEHHGPNDKTEGWEDLKGKRIGSLHSFNDMTMGEYPSDESGQFQKLDSQMMGDDASVQTEGVSFNENGSSGKMSETTLKSWILGNYIAKEDGKEIPAEALKKLLEEGSTGKVGEVLKDYLLPMDGRGSVTEWRKHTSGIKQTYGGFNKMLRTHRGETGIGEQTTYFGSKHFEESWKKDKGVSSWAHLKEICTKYYEMDINTWVDGLEGVIGDMFRWCHR